MDKPSAKPVPMGRRDHIAFLDPMTPNPQMIIFGGLGSNLKLLNDLWYYDLVMMTWSKPKVSGPPPEPRKDPAGIFAAGRYLFFGGASASGNDLNDLWGYVHQVDCLAIQTCSGCTGTEGCGWCWDNAKGQRCVSGFRDQLYVSGSCIGAPASGAFSTDSVMCPTTGFPSWAIALIVIGGVVILGIVVFAIMKMRKPSEYEEIQG